MLLRVPVKKAWHQAWASGPIAFDPQPRAPPLPACASPHAHLRPFLLTSPQKYSRLPQLVAWTSLAHGSQGSPGHNLVIWTTESWVIRFKTTQRFPTRCPCAPTVAMRGLPRTSPSFRGFSPAALKGPVASEFQIPTIWGYTPHRSVKPRQRRYTVSHPSPTQLHNNRAFLQKLSKPPASPP